MTCLLVVPSCMLRSLAVRRLAPEFGRRTNGLPSVEPEPLAVESRLSYVMRRAITALTCLVITTSCASTLTDPTTSVQTADTAETTPSTSQAGVTTLTPFQTGTGSVIQLPDDRFPTAAAFVDDRFWVIAETSMPEYGLPPAMDAVLLSIDRTTGRPDLEVALSDAPAFLAADDSAVWVAHWKTGAVSRIHPETGEVVATVVLELPFDFGGPDGRLFVPNDIVLGHDSVWVSTARGAVARIDVSSNEVTDIYGLAGSPPDPELAIGPAGVWVTGALGGLVHVTADTGEITTISTAVLGHAADWVFVPGDEIGDPVYVAGEGLGPDDRHRVSRVDAATFEVLGSTRFDEQIIYLGWLNGFAGALEGDGVFTHLSSIPQLGNQVNTTTFAGGQPISGPLRGAWEVDTTGSRMTRIDETGPAPVELPFEINDKMQLRPIPDDLRVSDDWVVLDPGPLSPTGSAAMIWTGGQIVIWGGEALGAGSTRSSGAAYRPDTDTWTSLIPAPLVTSSEAVWTGDELITWSGGFMAAAWQPESNTWRTIEDWPLQGSYYPRAVWTGQEILDVNEGLLVDPITGASRPIAEPPSLHERASVVWVDGYLVSVTGEGAYNLDTDTWTDMPDSGLTPLATAGATLGDTMVAVDYDMQASQYDPVTNSWTPYPEVPLRFSECFPRVHTFRQRQIAEHCSGLGVWNPDRSHWMPIAYPNPNASSTVIAAGDRLFVWGEGFYEFVGDPDQPSRLAVGISNLDVPDGWRVTTVGSVDSGGSIEVETHSSSGDSCTITAIHADAKGVLVSYIVDTPVVVDLQPYVGGEPTNALEVLQSEVDDRYHLVWATGTTDVIDLACDTQTDAEQLAPRFWSPYQ